jgi:uncharacterized protein YndB with AHSA1/START domain
MGLHEELGAVRRETVLNADRDAVWALVAEPEGLAAWLADDVDLPAVEPGAQGTVREGETTRRVTVEEVEPGRRVALTWCAPGEDASLVELTLDDDELGRTRLTVVELPLVRLRAATQTVPAALRGPRMLAAA